MAELIEVTGMVLAATPMGEYDKRVVLLTKELGKISAFAKGARRPGNHLMAAASSFAFGKFILYPGRNSYTVEKAEIKDYFRELAGDIEKAYYGYYFCELADYYARENENDNDMLQLIYYAFKALIDERIPNQLVRAVYELKMLVINGQYPEFFACANCGSTERLAGFSMLGNGLVCQECLNLKGIYRVSPSTVYTLQFVVATEIRKLFSFTVTDEVLTELKEILSRCMEAYVDKHMKSLDILGML